MLIPLSDKGRSSSQVSRDRNEIIHSPMYETNIVTWNLPGDDQHHASLKRMHTRDSSPNMP
jgi:hypothetical protein